MVVVVFTCICCGVEGGVGVADPLFEPLILLLLLFIVLFVESEDFDPGVIRPGLVSCMGSNFGFLSSGDTEIGGYSMTIGLLTKFSCCCDWRISIVVCGNGICGGGGSVLIFLVSIKLVTGNGEAFRRPPVVSSLPLPRTLLLEATPKSKGCVCSGTLVPGDGPPRSCCNLGLVLKLFTSR